MEYSKLLDLVSDLGYELAMNGAETFRVEESIWRVLKATILMLRSLPFPTVCTSASSR